MRGRLLRMLKVKWYLWRNRMRIRKRTEEEGFNLYVWEAINKYRRMMVS